MLFRWLVCTDVSCPHGQEFDDEQLKTKVKPVGDPAIPLPGSGQQSGEAVDQQDPSANQSNVYPSGFTGRVSVPGNPRSTRLDTFFPGGAVKKIARLSCVSHEGEAHTSNEENGFSKTVSTVSRDPPMVDYRYCSIKNEMK
jgi:hypothetical protein